MPAPDRLLRQHRKLYLLRGSAGGQDSAAPQPMIVHEHGVARACDSPARPLGRRAGRLSATLTSIMTCGLLLPGRGEAR